MARSSGKGSEPRYLGCYVRFKFKAPIRVHKQMPATHEPDPHPACGHPLPSDGRGAGDEGSSVINTELSMTSTQLSDWSLVIGHWELMIWPPCTGNSLHEPTADRRPTSPRAELSFPCAEASPAAPWEGGEGGH